MTRWLRRVSIPRSPTQSSNASHIWPGPEPRVEELLDQRRGVGAAEAVEPEDPHDRVQQAELLDPLRRPLRLDLGARDAPDLLGVGAEEGVVEAAAEAAHDPVLEAARVGVLELAAPVEVGERGADGLDQAEPAEDVGGPQRIVEEAAAIEDPREPRPGQELLAEHLLPELLDRLELGVEAVAAEVEAVALELDSLRDPADDPVGLEHGRLLAPAGQHPGRCQPGRSGAQDRGPEAGPISRFARHASGGV